jgi:tetratricopeptide (TPR) repeat protein
MDVRELQGTVLRNTTEISEIRRQLTDLTSREKRVEQALLDLRRRLDNCLNEFDRDRYKATDQRLLIHALASEILIFDKLGYDIGTSGSHFLLGVAALLEGRYQAALEQLKAYVSLAEHHDKNLGNACYLAGVISYNRRECNQAIEFFESAFRHSPEENRDWQSKIQAAELTYFVRKPREVIEKAFFDVEEQLKAIEGTSQHNYLRATLYLKLGNCYVGTFLEPKERNPMVNNQVAIGYYKLARKWCPRLTGSESLLPVVIDYSLAQALLLDNSVDMDLAQTPSELLADLFQRLQRIVLNKREEIILALCYFMLGTCAVYSTHVSRDVAKIHLEYARNQTLSVPSDVCFYSSITKELLSRDEFVKQVDYYIEQLEQQAGRRFS